ncbi:hypothetical protein NP233_g12250 [Leucocoprinus birnbaumii]|uniref:Nephrocystin 3-like N-terminal domain-containing protein n=1 Tax=Leucocoprinus birnbaumii TaxID=56174 RepID=A0AAD5YKK9_9AGAR|nr:hypothetical protein NP233_g12250 [Leucocoprinus birnbaumii]
MPDAFHDSAARYPPPKCHLGTRKEYIKGITDWALGESEHKKPILWMRGPFGIGKTAVAQSSAEALKPINKLLATLFFSRSNSDRDDPRRVIPSIVYQITTLCEPFANIIDARIRKDLSLTTKSLSTQFEELLVIPLSQIDAVAAGLEGRVIIIDGLDECRGTLEQCEIIRIIATSARNGTTPFRWFITSRPEDLIFRTMNTALVSSVTYRIELPVSRRVDHEILVFLTDEFTKIRESHGIPDSWPGEEVLALLVERGAGLWIYISTIVRFIHEENSLGPEDQLRVVMEVIGDVSNKVEPSNPLAEMDFFYTLIMQRIPSNMLEMVKRIMLIHSMGYFPNDIINLLRISEEQLRRYCTFIQSVMELRGTSLDPSSHEVLRLHFYHTSFIDYLTDWAVSTWETSGALIKLSPPAIRPKKKSRKDKVASGIASGYQEAAIFHPKPTQHHERQQASVCLYHRVGLSLATTRRKTRSAHTTSMEACTPTQREDQWDFIVKGAKELAVEYLEGKRIKKVTTKRQTTSAPECTFDWGSDDDGEPLRNTSFIKVFVCLVDLQFFSYIFPFLPCMLFGLSHDMLCTTLFCFRMQ